MKRLGLLVSLFTVLGFAFTFLSCEKDTKCVATIRVVSESGLPQENVAVELFANVKTGNPPQTVKGDVTATGTTDSGGEVKFTFKLPAIYDIRAVQVKSGPTQTLVATGIIKLEEGKGVSKEVTLKP